MIYLRLCVAVLLVLTSAHGYGVPARKPSRLHFPVVDEEPVLSPTDADLAKTVEKLSKVAEHLEEKVKEKKLERKIEEAVKTGYPPYAPPEEKPTEPPAEAPAEPPTEAPAEPPTQPLNPYAPPEEKPTEPPTEAPTEPPTEAPTEPPTEAPTEPPTEAPTQASDAETVNPYAPAMEQPETPSPAVEEPTTVVTHPTLPPTTTMKYVLNHEAARKYWATATFPTTTAAPATTAAPFEDVPAPVVPEEPKPNPYGPPVEQAPPVVEEMGPVEPEVKPVEEVPVQEAATTSAYVLNEDAAKKYWATAKVPESTTVPVSMPAQDVVAGYRVHTKKPVVPKTKKTTKAKPTTTTTTMEPPTEAPTNPPEVAQEEPQNPYAAPVEPEVKPAEDVPVQEITTTTLKYVLNEDAAKKYWATATFPTTTAAPAPTTTPSAPVPTTTAFVPMPAEDKPVHVGYGLPVEPEPEPEPEPLPPADEPVSKPGGY